MMTLDAPKAWAWELEDGSLCHWAEPDIAKLRRGGKPSPGAEAVCIRLVKEKDFTKMSNGSASSR